jgi:hypothetical protein
MEDYGIEADDYFSLALQLAIDYVPRFPKFKLKHGTYGKVMRDKGGRRTYWTPDKLDALATDVDRIKKKYKFSTDDDAIKHLTRAGKWARQSGRDADKWRKTLKNALAQARTIQRETNRLLAGLSPNPEN